MSDATRGQAASSRAFLKAIEITYLFGRLLFHAFLLGVLHSMLLATLLTTISVIAESVLGAVIFPGIINLMTHMLTLALPAAWASYAPQVLIGSVAFLLLRPFLGEALEALWVLCNPPEGQSAQTRMAGATLEDWLDRGYFGLAWVLPMGLFYFNPIGSVSVAQSLYVSSCISGVMGAGFFIAKEGMMLLLQLNQRAAASQRIPDMNQETSQDRIPLEARTRSQLTQFNGSRQNNASSQQDEMADNRPDRRRRNSI